MLLALATFNLQPSTARAQGTAFTYQGQLNSGTNPANGIYDLRLLIYDSSTGGNVLAGPVTNTAVAVTNGLFTTIMDFGAGVFTGSSNWLHIGVRTNGGGSFTPLSPRQELTPTPYAVFAEGASAGGLSGTIPAASLSGTYSSPVTLSNVSNSFSGNGTGLTNVNASLLGGLAASSFWQTTGNAGTAAGVNFVGTTDNQPLQLRSDNATGLQLQYVSRSSGEGPSFRTAESMNIVGGYGGNTVASNVIGATIAGGGELSGSYVFLTPSPNIVNGDFGAVGGGNFNTAGLYATVPGGFDNIATGDGSFAAGRYAQTTNDGSFIWSDGSQAFSSSGVNCFDVFATGGVFFHTGPAGVNLGNLAIDPTSQNSGTVGSYALVFGAAVGSSGEGIASDRSSGVNDLEFYTAWHNQMTIDHSGNVWVSNSLSSAALIADVVITPSLFAQSATLGVSLTTPLLTSDTLVAGTATVGTNLSTAGVTLDPNGQNPGNVDTNALVFGGAYGSTGEGIASKRKGNNPWDLEFYTAHNNRMTILNNGNVGIGTTTPSEQLEVNGNYLLVDGANGQEACIGIDNAASNVQVGSMNSAITSVAFWNHASGSYMHISCSSITINGGADLAEPFAIADPGMDIPQGAVVVIDDKRPGQLKMSNQPYDTRVAGVISGANGISPGIQLQQQGLLEGGRNVALTGRVYVQADTSNGAIQPGDLLTTSTTPGRAMKVSDHLRAQGAILGKAMTGLSEGNGMVLLLVTLQ
jgi:hypothetical protein